MPHWRYLADCCRSLFWAASALLLGAQASAQAPADFRGETITIQIGYGAGGGYDTYGRALARHYGRFIPGNPNVVVKNMPGAGSRPISIIFAPATLSSSAFFPPRPPWSP
jgi:hypothetical protein